MESRDKAPRKPDDASPQTTDILLSKIATAYPSGPVRRGTLKSEARSSDLMSRAPVIDEILVFDAHDHWFSLFLGCRALGLPFELSLRTPKSPGETAPPSWFVEPATRVAGAIADGAVCVPGVAWSIGSPLGGPTSPFTGFLTFPDLEFGELEPACVLQLVPITQAELELRGAESQHLCERLQGDRRRMIGTKPAANQ